MCVRVLLQSYDTVTPTPPSLLQILDLVKGMHYQLACQKYFEFTHGVSSQPDIIEACPSLLCSPLVSRQLSLGMAATTQARRLCINQAPDSHPSLAVIAV